MREQWIAKDVLGWGGYVLKEKLKVIKVSLKEWHAKHGRNIKEKVKPTKERLNELEEKGEEATL